MQHQAIMADPLRVIPDMEAKWLTFPGEGLPFEEGVKHLLDAHVRDGGDITDIEVSDLRDMAFGTLDGHHLLMANPRTGKAWKVRRTAWTGLMDRMGLGQGATDILLRRLPPTLQEQNLNVMLCRIEAPLPCVLRVRRDDILAMVSTKYAPVDTSDIVAIARESLASKDLLSQAMVRAVAWGGRDVIRVTFPEHSVEVKKDDIVSRGLDFRNGSWGGSAVSLVTSNVRLICLNGMTREEPGHSSFHFRHVGTRDRIEARVRDAIPQALAEGEKTVEMFREAPNREVENVGKMFSFFPKDALLVTEQEAVREAIKAELGVHVLGPKEAFSAFDAVNGMTSAAKALQPERRLNLEALAGEFLAHAVS